MAVIHKTPINTNNYNHYEAIVGQAKTDYDTLRNIILFQ